MIFVEGFLDVNEFKFFILAIRNLRFRKERRGMF